MDPCHTPGPGDEPPAADVVGLQRARRTRTTGGRNGPRPDSDDDIRGTPRAYERRCAPELRTTSAIVGGLLALARLCSVLPLLLPALAGVVVGLVGMPMPLAGPRVVTRIVGEHRPLPPVAMLRLRMLTGVMRIAVLSEILHGLEYPIS